MINIPSSNRYIHNEDHRMKFKDRTSRKSTRDMEGIKFGPFYTEIGDHNFKHS